MKEEPLILAGGFIRACVANETVTDADFFGHSTSFLESCVDTLHKKHGGKVHKTQNAFTYRMEKGCLPVQFITRWLYTNPEKLLKEFDFTVAKAAVWWDSDSGKFLSACDSRFYPDLAAKRVVYTRPVRHEDAGGSLLRVRKFLSRGYQIHIKDFAGVLARLVQGLPDIKDWETYSGVNIEDSILKLLKEVDPWAFIGEEEE